MLWEVPWYICPEEGLLGASDPIKLTIKINHHRLGFQKQRHANSTKQENISFPSHFCGTLKSETITGQWSFTAKPILGAPI